jgi:hypothetical protein
MVKDAQRAGDAVHRQRISHLPQRQVGGGERHAQAVRHQQHHHLRGPAAGGEVLGVAAEGDAGVVDDALVERGGDHRVEAAFEAAPDGVIEPFQQRQRVGGVGLTRRRPARQVNVQHRRGARGWRGGRLAWLERDQPYRMPECRGAFGQQVLVADEDELDLRLRRGADEVKTDVRPDAGRLADGERETNHGRPGQGAPA